MLARIVDSDLGLILGRKMNFIYEENKIIFITTVPFYPESLITKDEEYQIYIKIHKKRYAQGMIWKDTGYEIR